MKKKQAKQFVGVKTKEDVQQLVFLYIDKKSYAAAYKLVTQYQKILGDFKSYYLNVLIYMRRWKLYDAIKFSNYREKKYKLFISWCFNAIAYYKTKKKVTVEDLFEVVLCYRGLVLCLKDDRKRIIVLNDLIDQLFAKNYIEQWSGCLFDDIDENSKQSQLRAMLKNLFGPIRINDAIQSWTQKLIKTWDTKKAWKDAHLLKAFIVYEASICYRDIGNCKEAGRLAYCAVDYEAKALAQLSEQKKIKKTEFKLNIRLFPAILSYILNLLHIPFDMVLGTHFTAKYQALLMRFFQILSPFREDALVVEVLHLILNFIICGAQKGFLDKYTSTLSPSLKEKRDNFKDSVIPLNQACPSFQIFQFISTLNTSGCVALPDSVLKIEKLLQSYKTKLEKNLDSVQKDMDRTDYTLLLCHYIYLKRLDIKESHLNILTTKAHDLLLSGHNEDESDIGSFINRAGLYFWSQNYEKAYRSYNEYYNYFSQLTDKDGYGSVQHLFCAAVIHLKQCKFNQGIHLLDKVSNICFSAENNKNQILTLLYWRAHFLRGRFNQYDKPNCFNEVFPQKQDLVKKDIAIFEASLFLTSAAKKELSTRSVGTQCITFDYRKSEKTINRLTHLQKKLQKENTHQKKELKKKLSEYEEQKARSLEDIERYKEYLRKAKNKVNQLEIEKKQKQEQTKKVKHKGLQTIVPKFKDNGLQVYPPCKISHASQTDCEYILSSSLVASHPAVIFLQEFFSKEKALFVLLGGLIRSCLSGNTPRDIDGTTSMQLEVLKAKFDQCKQFSGAKIVGSTKVLLCNLHLGEKVYIVEITQTLKPIQNPTIDEVEMQLKQSASKLDFTCNSLIYVLNGSCSGKLYDFFGGMVHIKNKLLCVPLSVHQQNLQSYLRRYFLNDKVKIFRLIRLVCEKGYRLHPEINTCFMSISPQKIPLRLDELHHGVIYHHCKKILVAGSCYKALKKLEEYNLFKPLFPTLTKLLETPLQQKVYWLFLDKFIKERIDTNPKWHFYHIFPAIYAPFVLLFILDGKQSISTKPLKEVCECFNEYSYDKLTVNAINDIYTDLKILALKLKSMGDKISANFKILKGNAWAHPLEGRSQKIRQYTLSMVESFITAYQIAQCTLPSQNQLEVF